MYLEYENGNVEDMPFPTLEAIGEILDEDTGYLVGLIRRKASSNAKEKISSSGDSYIKVYENLIDLDDINDAKAVNKIIVPKSYIQSKNEYIALKITESAMYPEYLVGDIAIIQVQNDFDSGSICAVSINSTKITLREIYSKGKEILLKSSSYLKPNLTLKEKEIKILGKVIEIRRIM
jgi:hypothetical protein